MADSYVLVLNASYEPLQRVSLRHAIKMLVREVRYGAFRRTFQLPEGVTADQVEAESDNGMLRLRIRNVTKPVLPPQKVAVRAASSGQQRKTIEAGPPKQS